MSMSQKAQKPQGPALADLVNEWMRGDPLLCEHFKWEWPKSRQDFKGFFVGTHWREDTGSYAVAFVGTSPISCTEQVATWEWVVAAPPEQEKLVRRTQNVYYVPEDPQFFEQFKQGLIKGHNSLNRILKCSI